MTVRLLDVTRDGYPIVWDNTDETQEVIVYATGEKDDVHNKAPQSNNGRAGVFYPEGFSGKSKFQIKTLDGEIVDEGEVTITPELIAV